MSSLLSLCVRFTSLLSKGGRRLKPREDHPTLAILKAVEKFRPAVAMIIGY